MRPATETQYAYTTKPPCTHTHAHPTSARFPTNDLCLLFFINTAHPEEACRCSRAPPIHHFSDPRDKPRAAKAPNAAVASGEQTGTRRRAQVPPWCRALPLICIFHSEVIRLHGGLYERLLKQHLTRRVLRSLFTHSHSVTLL